MWRELTPEVFPNILDTPCVQNKLYIDSHLPIIRLPARVQTAYSRRETIDVEFNIEVNV